MGELGAAIQTGEHPGPYFPTSYIDITDFFGMCTLSSLVKGLISDKVEFGLPTADMLMED